MEWPQIAIIVFLSLRLLLGVASVGKTMTVKGYWMWSVLSVTVTALVLWAGGFWGGE